MTKIRLAIVFLLLSCVVSSAARPHHFYAQLSSWDGLPEASISSVCQDEFGRIWVGTRDGVYYYTGEKFLPFNNADYLAACSLNTSSIMQDSKGCIWIVSSANTGFYDISSNNFTVLEDLEGSPVRDIDLTPDGLVWLTATEGIWKYDNRTGTLSKAAESQSFSPYRCCVAGDNSLAFTSRNNSIYLLDTAAGTVKEVRSDRESATFQQIVYVGGSNVLVSDGLHEICLVNLETGKTESLIDSSVILNKAEVTCILYKDGLYWIGTTYGILIYDPVTHSLEKQFPDEHSIATMGAENVRCLYDDKNGNVWAGTWDGGLRGCMAYEEGFRRFVPDDTPHSLFRSSTRAICDGPDGQIWIGSEGGHLSRFNPEDQTFEDFTSAAGIAFGTAITDIERIGSLLWITSYGDGIRVFDPDNGKVVRKYSLPVNDCMTVLQASDGFIYAGTTRGLFRLDNSSDSFKIVDAVGTPFVHSMIEDDQEHLIISTYFRGFGIYDIPTATYWKGQDAQQDSFTSFAIDRRGTLWATTDGAGLCKIDYQLDDNSSQVKHFDIHSGMPSNSCGSITEGPDGNLWIATAKGLVEFDPVKEKVIKTYMQADHVIGRHFTFGSNFKTDDGFILLGTTEGLLMFDPVFIKEKFGHSAIHITDIALRYSTGNAVNSLQDLSAITSKSIRIRQKDAGYIFLSFSPMIYANPSPDSYECTLEGRGQRNRIVVNENHVAYSGLRPGSYQFTVNYEGYDDPATEASMDIVITAPWYRSIVALILYLLILSALLYTYLKSRMQKKKEETQRREELMEAKKEKDLAHEKMAFYTNIAHEIRTPVSVLQILLDRASTEGIKDDMKSMRLNVERLKKLCDDLLDFRKMDSGQVHLVFAPEDICAITRKAFNSFETAAKARNLEMKAEFSKDTIIAHCDADAIESVICNLFSNSIKYSASFIDCKVYEEDGNVVIRVENDGVRVPDNERERIFEAFYQSKAIEKNGTGLGLTYSRKIASLHDGRLYLDTGVEDRNSFVLEIPLNSKKPVIEESQIPESSPVEEDVTDLHPGRPVVLVVEDNETMRDLIREALVTDYDILTACDGEEALGIVRSSSIDLVVSDIMMPKMDGCELCNAIKEDITLSHIPVLLLTAAVGVDTHIRSLKSGADAYIEKPFKMDVLKANISNLFRNRDIRNEQFSASPLSHYSFSSVSKMEQDFMNTLHSFIQDHLSEASLTIDRLASAMAVSRATLTRKVKANTGVTVNEYVRVCRLKKAAELLAENNYRINEIAYLVGFSSPSYFTSSFQKQFGKLPSEFTKKKTK